MKDYLYENEELVLCYKMFIIWKILIQNIADVRCQNQMGTRILSPHVIIKLLWICMLNKIRYIFIWNFALL